MIKNDLMWGTYGPNADQELTFKPLNSLTTKHLHNILHCCGWHINQNYKDTIVHILKKRKKKAIFNISEQHSLTIYKKWYAKWHKARIGIK